MPKRRTSRHEVPLGELRELGVMYPGDLHELATFVLKAYAARDREHNESNPPSVVYSRPTLYGLTQTYASVTRTSKTRAERIVVEAGFDLGANVGPDPPPGTSDALRRKAR